MIYVIFISVIFSLILLITNYRSKMSWIFFTMLTGMNLFISAMFLYITRFTSYSPIIDFDNRLYSYISRFNINFYAVSDMFNIGLAICMFAPVLFLLFFNYPYKNKASSVIEAVLIFALTHLFLTINSSNTYQHLYLLFNSSDTGTQDKICLVIDIIKYINITSFLFINLLPFKTLFDYFRKTKVLLRKRHALILSACFFVLDVFLVSLIIMSPIDVLTPSVDTLLKIAPVRFFDNTSFLFAAIIMLIVFNIILIWLQKYKVIDRIYFSKNYAINKKTKLLASDLHAMLHSYKNTFLTINILTLKIQNHFGTPESLSEVKEIANIAETNLNSIGKVLDMFKDINPSLGHIDISVCISEAVSEASLPANITVHNNICTDGLYVYADAYHIKKMLSNLFTNSAEAIVSSHIPDGVIDIFCDIEDSWLILDICDNGCGIAPKLRKKIFKPLYSTKNNQHNWGVGLTYVKKVIDAHLGLIVATENQNYNTDFQILLPLSKSAKGEYE